MLSANKQYIADIERVIESKLNWEQLAGKSFLIIGSTGLIGSFLIDILMHKNLCDDSKIEIYALGRSKEKLKKRFANYLSSPFFHIIEGDVTKPLDISTNSDYVISGASNTHPNSYAEDPIGTIMTNILGTQNVLDYVSKHQVTRTLFLSTVEVYGENRGDVSKFDEEYCGYIDSNTLRAGYPEGKRASEALCQAYIAQYDLDIVIPRICRSFGPTMQLEDSKASSQFILKAVNNENIVLKSLGNQNFSYGYVADVVYALLYLLEKGSNGEAYNVGHSTFDIQLKDLAEMIASINHKKVVFDLPNEKESKGFSKVSTALLDTAKLEKLGWYPLFTFKESLEHTVQILKEMRK